jgi:hypothetical protein
MNNIVLNLLTTRGFPEPQGIINDGRIITHHLKLPLRDSLLTVVFFPHK